MTSGESVRLLRDAVGALLRRDAPGALLPSSTRPYEHARLSTAQRAALRDAAAAHRVLPLLARAAGAAAEPELTEEARRIAMRSLAAVGTLRRALAALAAAGVPALAWKGPVLSQLAWGELGFRESDDIDLVVAPDRLPQAREALRTEGWVRRHAMSDAQEAAIFRGQGAFELTGPFDPPLLELHWEFSARRYAGRLPVAAVLARATHVRIAGSATLTPDAADTLALLAQHGCKHAWGRLEDLAVFSALAVRDPAAVVEAHARALPAGGARAVLLAVELSARMLGVERPAALARPCERDGALNALAHTVAERWDRAEADGPPTMRWDLRWTEGAAHRLRLLGHAALDPTMREWEALRLPDSLVGLYPVLRPLRRVWSALGRKAGTGERSPRR